MADTVDIDNATAFRALVGAGGAWEWEWNRLAVSAPSSPWKLSFKMGANSSGGPLTAAQLASFRQLGFVTVPN
eukprot:COSAG04_NODE_14494_length_565_cov_1.450644_1_plen_72_part_10